MKRPLTLLFLFLLVACEPPPLDSAVVEEGGDPTIKFIFPDSDDEKVYCSTFMIAVQIDNFELLPADQTAETAEGIGHWHLLNNNQDYIDTVIDQFYFYGTPLEDGRQGLYAELVAENHQSFDPRIVHFAEFTVDDEAEDDPATEDVFEGCWGGSSGGSSGGY